MILCRFHIAVVLKDASGDVCFSVRFFFPAPRFDSRFQSSFVVFKIEFTKVVCFLCFSLGVRFLLCFQIKVYQGRALGQLFS